MITNLNQLMTKNPNLPSPKMMMKNIKFHLMMKIYHQDLNPRTKSHQDPRMNLDPRTKSHQSQRINKLSKSNQDPRDPNLNRSSKSSQDPRDLNMSPNKSS